MAFDQRTDGPANNPYSPLMGRTFVSIDDTTPISILDSTRQPILGAWVARLIPGNGNWPSAGELDTVTYIDGVLRLAPELRPVLLDGIDTAHAVALRDFDSPFVSLNDVRQTTVLKEVESSAAREAFAVILELTYEAYYRAEAVLGVVRERTGFDIGRTVQGVPLKPFDTDRLTRVSLLPNRYRSAS